MKTAWQDIRYGLRLLARNPGFTAGVVLILAVSVGANTAIFSIVNAVLLQPLPFPQPHRLVQVKEDLPPWRGTPRGIREYIRTPELCAWRERKDLFAQMAAYDHAEANLVGGSNAVRIECGKATSELFPMLGVRPILGRGFLPVDEQPGAPPVAVLSHRLWHDYFGADPNILARTILLENRRLPIVGVLPAGFQFPRPYDLWIPLTLEAGAPTGGKFYTGVFDSPSGASVIGRLAPGISTGQARPALDVLLLAVQPEDSGRVVLTDLHEQLVGNTKLKLCVLWGAVGFVLLIACANVANLLLARGARRQREIAVRTALGATRGRVLRQLLSESVMLGVLGGTGGVVFACLAMELLQRLTLGNRPLLRAVTLDGWVLGFTLLLALLTGLVFGLAPAWDISRCRLQEALREGIRGTNDSRRSGRLRQLLVISEVALSLVLLTGAGLLLKSFAVLRGVDPGFRADRVLTATIGLSHATYAEPHQQVAYFTQVLQRVGALPGVEKVGASAVLPLTPYAGVTRVVIEGLAELPRGASAICNADTVSPDYFRALGIPLVRGRFFADSDVMEAPGVAIVNEEFVRRFLPQEESIGRRIMGPRGTWLTIVGVVGNVRLRGPVSNPEAQVYRCCLQYPAAIMSLAVRTRTDPERLTAAVRAQIRNVDPDQPAYDFMSLDRRLSNAVSPQRTNLLLLGSFAVLALGLATLGVFAVVSYTVAQRTQEIGVRTALGARRIEILRLFVGQGMALALTGTGMGLVLSFLLTRCLASMLYAVKPTDPLIFVSASALLTAVALLASYLPARRAARIDPMVALRCE
jgi:predicted permease